MSEQLGRFRIAILGASGYTGAELVRLLHGHPRAEIVALTADRHAGQAMGAVFPHLGHLDLPELVRIEDVAFDGVDVAFCALPHGTTQDVVAGLPAHIRVIDLSADFRLADPAAYERWYGDAHRAPELQRQAVYGLTEIHRSAVAQARLVANPGCYTSTGELALIPLVAAGLIDPAEIVVDGKSGVSGAGRALKEPMLFAEVGEGARPYGVGKHRHNAEYDQEISRAAGRAVTVSFTPHLVPMNRGIVATAYVRLAQGAEIADLRAALAARYRDEPFIRLLPEGKVPATQQVRGSNHVTMNAFADRIPGRAIVVAALDNLVKGASGQAIQNMNVMLGLDETLGLQQAPLFP